MTNEQLSASLSYLGDELLAECGARRQRPKRSWRTALIKAACMALVLFSGIYVAGRFDYSLGELKWRTVDFREVRYDEGDHFGCPVMNFSDPDVPYTRAIEFKNFNPERRASQNPDRTVVWEEYSRFAERGDEPYYPINTEADKALYARYEELAKAEPLTVFGGRLGTYKYYDMHNVIDTALTAYEQQVEPLLKK